MEDKEKIDENRKKEKITESNQRTYDEISAENNWINNRLGKRVLALLEELQEKDKEINQQKVESRQKNEKKEETDAINTELKSEIEKLKKEIVEKNETIDSLVEERDERSHHVYKLRLKLADAWNISLQDDAEKVREVARLEDTNENPKSYCDAAKNMKYNESKSTCEIATDSGIDIESLHKLIDERVAVSLDTKFGSNVHNNAGDINRNSEIVPKINSNVATAENPDTIRTPIYDTRELNIIIHGIEEEGDTRPVIAELFSAMKIEQNSNRSTDRLGSKSPEKIRPIRVVMKSHDRKQALMSSVWRLKNGPEKFRRISITEDYTQEERQEIKRWVDEAKRMTQESDNEYVWKVRGSPRSQLRLISMRT